MLVKPNYAENYASIIGKGLESSSVGLPNANLNASNEIPNSCEHSSQSFHSTAPSCWSVKQKDYFTSHTPGLFFQMERLVVANVETLTLLDCMLNNEAI
jgi:hypothetical protein